MTREALENFWRWFGDSKVVDASGRPLVLYHGTGTTIDEFKYEFTNQGNDQHGSGFYFTTDYKQALGYTKRTMSDTPKLGGEDKPNVIAVYLALREPLDSEFVGGGLTKANVRKYIERSPILDEALENWGDVNYEGKAAVMRKAIDAYYSPTSDRQPKVRAMFSLATDFYGDHVREFNEAVRDISTYDGVVAKFENGVSHYVAFFPEQVKSATANVGTFDPMTGNILHQPAYHGSPHDFTEFSLAKVGSGEGAQAFGWGIYLAENQTVAKEYQTRLSDASSHARFVVGGKELDPSTPEKHGASLLAFNDTREIRSTTKRWLSEYEGNLGMRDTAEKAGLDPAEYWTRLNDFVQSHSRRDIKVVRGRLYQVHVDDAVVAKMLDWDQKISAQTPEVRAALESMNVDMFRRWQENGAWEHVSGETLYKHLADGLTRGAAEKGRDRDASLALLAAGITGLKYLDEGSRGSRATPSAVASASAASVSSRSTSSKTLTCRRSSTSRVTSGSKCSATFTTNSRSCQPRSSTRSSYACATTTHAAQVARRRRSLEDRRAATREVCPRDRGVFHGGQSAVLRPPRDLRPRARVDAVDLPIAHAAKRQPDAGSARRVRSHVRDRRADRDGAARGGSRGAVHEAGGLRHDADRVRRLPWQGRESISRRA
jgi:hypothetical protein